MLTDHYRKAQTQLIRERVHAVLLNADGQSIYDVSKILYRDEKTIREWIKSFHKTRLASLFPAYQENQNASKLTREQRQEITRVLASPPSDHGIPKGFWDVSSLREYVVARFGVVYESVQSYHFLFHISNFSFKLPATFDRRRNDTTVEERIKEVRKIIEPYLTNPSWVVLAGDESRITWEAIIRRAWLPKGKPTILKVHREHQAQSFVGFLNVKNGKPHIFPVPWQNQKEIIYVLVNFPPYAPDTNPQEHIWKWSKDQIANHQYASLADLAQVFKKTVMSRIYPYQI